MCSPVIGAPVPCDVRLAFHFERETAGSAHQRQVAGGFDGLHTGKRTDPFEQLSVERTRSGVIAISSFGRGDAGRDEALRSEAGIDSKQPGEAADQQARANRQQHRDGDLANHQQAGRPAERGAGTPVLDFEGRLHVGSRRRIAGIAPNPKPVTTLVTSVKPSTQRSTPISSTRGMSADIPLTSSCTPQNASSQSGRPSHQGEHGAFGQELPDDAAAAGAERAADRHLPLPGARAGEQQVRHVRARDEEHESHGSENDEQTRPHVADEPVLQQDDFAVRAPRGRKLPERIGLPQLRRARPQFRLGLRRCRTWREPGDDLTTLPAAPERGGIAAIECVGNPKLGAGQGEVERRRHDPDDAPRLGIDQDVAPDDARIPAEALAPQRVTEHDHGALAGLLLGRAKPAAKDGGDPERRENIGGEVRARDALGLAAFRQIEADVPAVQRALADRPRRDLSETGIRRPASGRPRRAGRADGRAAAAAAPR